MTSTPLDQLWRALDPIRDAAGTPMARDLTLTLFFLSASDPRGWAEVVTSGRPGSIERLLDRYERLYRGTRDNLPSLRPMSEFALTNLVEIIDVLRQTGDPAETFQFLLEAFADQGGLKQSEFYTPSSIASILTNTLSLETASSLYDPACRFGELLVSAGRGSLLQASQGLSFHGTALNSSSFNIAQLNLHLNGIPGQIDLSEPSNLFGATASTRTYSRIIANPPFNQPWADHEEPFFGYERTPKGNANFGWLQHAVHLLEPDGRAAILMPNSTLFSTNSRELSIRKRMVDNGCVEAIIALPPSLFYNTRIPVCVWLLTASSDRSEILLIDASAAGHMATRRRRILGESEIWKITDTVKTWRSEHSVNEAQNASTASLSEIGEMNYNLTPAVHLAQAPPILATGASRSLADELTSRLLTLKEEADKRDAIADQLLRGLKW
jgi:type I restriction enzyme M protein